MALCTAQRSSRRSRWVRLCVRVQSKATLHAGCCTRARCVRRGAVCLPHGPTCVLCATHWQMESVFNSAQRVLQLRRISAHLAASKARSGGAVGAGGDAVVASEAHRPVDANAESPTLRHGARTHHARGVRRLHVDNDQVAEGRDTAARPALSPGAVTARCPHVAVDGDSTAPVAASEVK